MNVIVDIINDCLGETHPNTPRQQVLMSLELMEFCCSQAAIYSWSAPCA